VQAAVDGVQEQLQLRRVAAVRGILRRHLVPDHHLALQHPRPAVGVREGEHVGRLVVLEELVVQPVDVGVVHERDRHFTSGHALALEHRPGGVLQPLELERVVVGVGD
jgi:hypothetical protein